MGAMNSTPAYGRTDFLFARPSFLEGWARLFDFGDTLTEFNRSPTPDACALRQDWLVVGDAIRRAMTQFAEQSGLRA